jgi:hypothetical protein
MMALMLIASAAKRQATPPVMARKPQLTLVRGSAARATPLTHSVKETAS